MARQTARTLRPARTSCVARAVAVAVFLAALVARPAVARADELADEQADVEARIAFLEQRIATQREHAELWWKGWVSFYAFGAVVQGVRASWATNPAVRADLWISVVKSMGAFTRFVIQPYGGIRGLEPEPAGWSQSPAARLARAEHILRANADRTNAFGPWFAHLINFGINGIGTVIVGAGYDDWETGIISGAIGFGVGELVIFSGPWEADSDLEAYEAGAWQVGVAPGQANLTLSF